MRNATLQLKAAHEIWAGPQKKEGVAESPHSDAETRRELIVIGSG